VISDNGRHYDSQVYSEFARSWGFDHVTSSPHYPRSNGFIERSIQTVKRSMKKARASKQDLNLALLCLRATPIDHEIPSPAELLYTRKIKSNLPVKLTNPINQKDRVYSWLEHRQLQQKEYHDRSAKDLPPLVPGQPVLVQHHQTGNWEKAEVKEKCSEPRSYRVTMNNGHTLWRNRHHLHEDQGKKKQTKQDGGVVEKEKKVEINNETVPNEKAEINNETVSNETKTTRSGREVKRPSRYDR
jgi:transposase InsO family protein